MKQASKKLIQKKKKEEISKEAELVQKDLDEAKPKLDRAVKVMASIREEDIKPLAGAKAPVSLRYYFECSCLIMGKRLLPVNEIKDWVFNSKGDKIVYFAFSWDSHVITYLKNGSFFGTLSDFQKRINENRLKINDETLELIKPLLDTKFIEKEDVMAFDDKIANNAGGEAAVTLAQFCRFMDDYVKAVREVIPKKLKVDEKKKWSLKWQ